MVETLRYSSMREEHEGCSRPRDSVPDLPLGLFTLRGKFGHWLTEGVVAVGATSRGTRSKAGLAVAGLAVVLAGCGNAASSRTGARIAPPVLSAYTKTTAAKTAKIAIVENVRSGGQVVKISGTGVVGFISQRSILTLSIPQIGMFNMRIIPPELYMRLPAGLSADLPAGKSWLSLDLDAVSRAKLGASLSELTGPSAMPTQFLGYLQAVSTSGVRKVGSAVIRGTATTEYTATVDLTKVAAHKSAQAQAAVKDSRPSSIDRRCRFSSGSMVRGAPDSSV